MRNSAWLLIIVMLLSVLFSGCELSTDPETLSQVEILNPATGSVLSDVTDVTLSILNNDDLKYVQIMIDGIEVGRINKGVSKWSFNPVFYNDGGKHTMIAITTDDGGEQSQSGVLSFSVDPASRLYPVYTTPASGYIYPEGGEVVLDWDPVVNAEEYTVQISEEKTFTTVLSETTTTADQVSFGTLENKVYYIRMNAVNKAERTADWANSKKLYVGINEITWLNVFDYGAGPEWANSVTDLPDSTLITVGPCWDAYMDYAKISVIKTDLNGDVIWQKTAGPENSIIYGNSVIHDGEYIYITGGIYNSNENIYMIKLDLDGNTIWEKTFGDYYSWGYSAKLGPDGNIYVQCDYNDSDSVCKIGPAGNLIYTYSAYSANWLNFDFDPNDQLVILYGEYYDVPRRVKLDANGNELSDEAFGTTMIDYSSQIFAGQEYLYVYEEDERLIKFGYDGSFISDTDVSGYNLNRFSKSGDYFYAAGSDYSGTGLMLKINSSMAVESSHSYGCGPLFNLKVLADGSVVLCGVNTAELQSSSNMVVLRTDKAGDCDEKSSPVKKEGEKLSVKFDRLK